jgi:aldose 1-epimerase
MSHDPSVIELLDDETGATARILVGLGLNCFSFRPVVAGQAVEVLWSEPDFALGRARAAGSGIPLMFPFPGRLRGKSLAYAGKVYRLKSGEVAGNAIHGYVLDRPWRVVLQERSKLIAEFQGSVDDPERFEFWPADYRLTATYAVRGNTLALEMVIENPTARDTLPFGFGTHPYFRVPLGGATEHCTVRVPAREYWELMDMLPSGRKLPCDAARDLSGGKPLEEMRLDDVLTGLGSEHGRVAAQIVDSASARKMTLAFDDSFGQCVVYNPPHREAICIEPVTTVPNAYELRQAGIATGLRELAPGESFRANVEISVH